MVRRLLLTSCHSPLPPLKLWNQQLVQLHCYYCHFNLSGPSHLLLLLVLCLFPQFWLKSLPPLMPSASSLTQVNGKLQLDGKRSNGRRRVDSVTLVGAVEWPVFLSGGKCWKCARGGLLGAHYWGAAGKTLGKWRTQCVGVHFDQLHWFPSTAPKPTLHWGAQKWSLSMKFEHHRDMSGCRSVDCVKT